MNIYWLVDLGTLLRMRRHSLHLSPIAAACLLISLVSARGADATQPGVPGAPAMSVAGEDPYLWLEDVTAERSLNWVREQNALSTKELESSPDFEPIRSRLLAILDSKERIPYVAKHGRYYYNFWRDQTNVRGLWRRTSLEEYKKAEPAWEVVLDLDQLACSRKGELGLEGIRHSVSHLRPLPDSPLPRRGGCHSR